MLTQLLSWMGSEGPGARSGSSVPASMPFAIAVLDSRFVVRWTLMPVLASNGFSTARYAASSAPPQATHWVTSFDPEVVVVPPPVEQATRSKMPPIAISRELSLAKTSAIPALLHYDPSPGRLYGG